MSGIGGSFGSMSQVLVASAAGSARTLVDFGSEGSEALWRFDVLELVDDSDAVLRRDGVGAAARVFAGEPDLTGTKWDHFVLVDGSHLLYGVEAPYVQAMPGPSGWYADLSLMVRMVCGHHGPVDQ